MRVFTSWNQMLDYGKTLDGQASVVRLAEHNYYLAYTLTPNPAPMNCGVGYSLVGEWQRGEIILR
ncbi:MAG: hypothetical protein KGI27_09795 [Thaumarchaeota archaeon]|nr:hypothetical protein [Nitrososphaerota archaeon]